MTRSGHEFGVSRRSEFVPSAFQTFHERAGPGRRQLGSSSATPNLCPRRLLRTRGKGTTSFECRAAAAKRGVLGRSKASCGPLWTRIRERSLGRSDGVWGPPPTPTPGPSRGIGPISPRAAFRARHGGSFCQWPKATPAHRGFSLPDRLCVTEVCRRGFTGPAKGPSDGFALCPLTCPLACPLKGKKKQAMPKTCGMTCVFSWWRRWVSNPRPQACKARGFSVARDRPHTPR